MPTTCSVFLLSGAVAGNGSGIPVNGMTNFTFFANAGNGPGTGVAVGPTGSLNFEASIDGGSNYGVLFSQYYNGVTTGVFRQFNGFFTHVRASVSSYGTGIFTGIIMYG